MFETHLSHSVAGLWEVNTCSHLYAFNKCSVNDLEMCHTKYLKQGGDGKERKLQLAQTQLKYIVRICLQSGDNHKILMLFFFSDYMVYKISYNNGCIKGL